MGYTEVKLQELATGALLHDIGKTKIEPALINKRAALNEEEKVVMRSHAMLGFDLLRNCQGTMTLPAIHIALQHHEQYNGDGYPRGLSNGEIHEYSRIVAIADVYDAITSDRPYRKAMLPHEAYELMLVKGSQHFDPMILPIFLQRIAIYPVGTVVRLNTGDIGVVLSVPPEMPLRPTLRLILDKKRRLYPGVVAFDMQNHLTSFIDQVVDGQDLMKLI
jgi:HD-GYP domain-containing protein (c-di-GMP phosphodiesterase class II)